MRRIQRRGQGRAGGEHLVGPVAQWHIAAAALQLQAGLAAALGSQMLVVLEFGDFFGRVGRAVALQAVQQEHVQHAHGALRNAHGLERIEVHQPHFDIFHTALAQRMQRALAAVHGALGTDGAVELVFNLQQAGAQLVVIATGIADAQLLVGRIGLGQRFMQRLGIAVQTVVADIDGGLGIALVAQTAHAQRGGIGQVQRMALGVQRLQLMLAAVDKARTQCRRRAKQVQQHKGMAAEVANQREVLLGAHARHRPVVVDAGNHLHAPAIAVAQAHAVDAFRAPGIGRAIACQRNGFIGRQAAGHAGHPEHLVAGLLQAVVDMLVHLDQLVQALRHAELRARDQLDLRFAVIGGDVRMRQRRTQGARMRCQRQPSRRQCTQSFLFDAAADLRQAFGGGNWHKLLRFVHSWVPIQLR